jgi:hypothetical protein
MGLSTNLEGAKQALVHTHHGTGVVKLATVVRSAEQRNELTLRKELVAILDDLVGTTYEVHIMFLEEPGNDIGAKGEGDTAIVLAPARDVLVRIRPKKIAEQAAVRNLVTRMLAPTWVICVNYRDEKEVLSLCITYVSGAHDATDLLHRVQVRAEATVHGKDLLIDDGGNGQAVEAVGKRLPQLDVVSTLALVVEAIDAVDGRALVVTPQDEKVLGILDLVGKEQADSLKGLLASVYVVTQEKVVGLRREAAVFKEAEQVVILPVDIAADLRMKKIHISHRAHRGGRSRESLG